MDYTIVSAVAISGEDAGHVRYTYRLRVSSAARMALLGEWDRCRWIWNQCVATSKTVYLYNTANPGEEQTCGPAQLDKMLTGWRGEYEWLGAGASVPQQQIIRDFTRSRAKAQKDIQKRLPVRQRSGMPRFKKKDLAEPTLNYTRRGFRIKDGRLHLAGGIVLAVVWSREPSGRPVVRAGVPRWHRPLVRLVRRPRRG